MSGNKFGGQGVRVVDESNKEIYTRISSAIESVKKRPESRRGPFILSDSDLNTEFQIK